jgi:RNA polymerase sigma-70 factor (ECF subfamily)
VSQRTPPDLLPDASLIHRFLAGDERAFRALYRRHSPRLRMVVMRLLGNRRSETDDVLQETWLAACRGLHRYRGDAKFGTWLTTIGIRTTRHRLALTRLDETGLFEELAAPPATLPHAAIDLERAIDRLPDHQRMVLVLHDIEGFTHEEIGRQLGVAVGTSKATLSRARSALRHWLNGGGMSHAV